MSKKYHAKVNAAGHIRGQQGLLFLSLIDDLAPEEIFIVPLEVAKKVHWSLICDGAGRIIRPDFDVNALRDGLDTFIAILRQEMGIHTSLTPSATATATGFNPSAGI